MPTPNGNIASQGHSGLEATFWKIHLFLSCGDLDKKIATTLCTLNMMLDPETA